MTTAYDIAEVARRTGLSTRALRFYEARGLVQPLRTATGRRLFGAGELARLHAILALKQAGFSLAAIGAMLTKGRPDLGRLIAAQLDMVEARAAALNNTRTLLRTLQSRIDRGEPIDVATLCSLIQQETCMTSTAWRGVIDRHFTPEEQAHWAEAGQALPPGFDAAAYQAQWQELGRRIEAALPLDPASDAAKAFVREWMALLQPFAEVATPAMWAGSTALYQRMPEWEKEADPGFSSRAWALIREAAAIMRAAGEPVGPQPAPLEG